MRARHQLRLTVVPPGNGHVVNLSGTVIADPDILPHMHFAKRRIYFIEESYTVILRRQGCNMQCQTAQNDKHFRIAYLIHPVLFCFFPLFFQLTVYVIHFPPAYTSAVEVFARFTNGVVLHVTRFEQSGFPPVYISGYFPIIITVGNNQPALLTMQTAVLVGRFVNKLSIARIIFAIKPVLTVGFQVKFTAAAPVLRSYDICSPSSLPLT